MIDLDELATEIHSTAKEKGFWNVPSGDEKFSFYAYKLAMIHSEVTEVLEALRKRKGGFEVVEELADIQIRLLDLKRGLEINGEISQLSFEKVLKDKVDYNKTRPVKHGVRG